MGWEEQLPTVPGRVYPGWRGSKADQGGEPGYYLRTCFKLFSGDGEGSIDLGDGGFTDWAARLLGDRKERLLTSAISLERLADSTP